jgi:hypothetical protein
VSVFKTFFFVTKKLARESVPEKTLQTLQPGLIFVGERVRLESLQTCGKILD